MIKNDKNIYILITRVVPYNHYIGRIYTTLLQANRMISYVVSGYTQYILVIFISIN